MKEARRPPDLYVDTTKTGTCALRSNQVCVFTAKRIQFSGFNPLIYTLNLNLTIFTDVFTQRLNGLRCWSHHGKAPQCDCK